MQARGRRTYEGPADPVDRTGPLGISGRSARDPIGYRPQALTAASRFTRSTVTGTGRQTVLQTGEWSRAKASS